MLVLSGTDGTVTAPPMIGSTAGTTTGLYYPTTNQLALATAGAEALRIDNNQQVGIGTSSPIRQLHMSHAGSCEQILEQSDGKSNNKKWNLLVDTGSSTVASNFSVRMLNDAGTNSSTTYGISISGTNGKFTTGVVTEGRYISPGSVPAGSVIQTKYNDLGTGSISGNSATAVNSGFSVTITPQYSTSKILHIVTVGATYTCDGRTWIYRNGSVISPGLLDTYRTWSSYDSVNDATPFTFTYMDSPASTSTQTYSLWVAATGCGNAYWFGSSSDFNCSWITMEIAV